MNVTAIPSSPRHVEPGSLRLATVGYGVFRVVNAALMLPCSILRVPQRTPWPFELGAAAGAVMLSLLDRDSRLWLGVERAQGERIFSHLQWLTGCSRGLYPEHADIAYIDDPEGLAAVDRLGAGSMPHADGAATLVIEVRDLEAAAGPLSGRDIDRAGPIEAALPHMPLLAQWRKRRARSGRLVDVVLTCGDALVCLPGRSASDAS